MVTSYIIQLDTKSGLPAQMMVSELSDGLAKGWIEHSEDPYVPPTDPSEKDLGRRDYLWSLLSGILKDEPAIYDRQNRATLLESVSASSGMPKTNLYPLLRRYWQRGKTPNAFLTANNKKGGAGIHRRSHHGGRTREDGSSQGKILDEDDYIYFDEAIRKYYLTRQQPTMKDTFDRLVRDHYSTQDADGVFHLLPAGQIPSLRQFRYWYKQHYDIKTETQEREGEKAFSLKKRSVTGSADFALAGPGSQFQVDATIGDIYLVSQFDRRDIIGRPVLYFVMDTFSRMVTGMYVGLEGPSWAGMMEALYNASADKVDFCHRYNIEITEDMWPCHHLPSVLLGDRGELESSAADGLTSPLGIRVDNAPPYRGDLKPIIERHFRTIDGNASAFLPGRVRPDMSARGGPDYRLDAKLDLRQFTQIIINCVIYYNNFHYLSGYEKNPQMLRSDVEAIPVQLWNWGIRNQSGHLRSFPEKTVRTALLPVGNASVTEKGIRFKGLFYTCPQAVDNLWFETARKDGRYTIPASYDPRDLGRIYVRDPASGSFVLCELLNWQKKYEGKSLPEVLYEQEKHRIEEKNGQRREQEAKINLDHTIESIVQGAVQLAPDTKGIPKSQRVSDIRENRANEKNVMRREESFVSGKAGLDPAQPQDTPEPSDTADVPDEALSPVLRMIKKQVEERNKNGS